MMGNKASHSAIDHLACQSTDYDLPYPASAPVSCKCNLALMLLTEQSVPSIQHEESVMKLLTKAQEEFPRKYSVAQREELDDVIDFNPVVKLFGGRPYPQILMHD